MTKNVRQLFDLADRVAIITGGATGLGFQIAQGLAEAGADVVICSRNLTKCEEAAAKIKSLGVRSMPIAVDVTSPEMLSKMVADIVKEFGKIDVLVNNSGVAWAAPPEESKIEDWRRVMETNVTGAFLCSQYVGRIMISQKSGSIINNSSISGMRGISAEILDTISYSTSKGALIAFTKDLATKWAKYNIRVNALAPSFFPTHLTEWVVAHRKEKIVSRIPLGRLGEDDDLKGPAVFLASDASKYITGQVIAIDGGCSNSLQ